jgi:hypothetical protein
MRVAPASNMPLMVGKCVIINLQKTPIDDYAALVIHEKIDKVV